MLVRFAPFGLLLLAAHCSASDALPVRNGRAASLAYLRFAPRSHTLHLDESRVSYSLLVANEFRKVGPIDEDAETWRLALEFGHGLKEGVDWFIEVPLISRSGGMLDPVIDWWHNDVLGDPNPLRDATPQGRSHIEYPGAAPFGAAVGIGDVTVSIGGRLEQDVVGRVGLKLPTGNPSMLTGSGGFDVGAAVDVRRSLSRSLVLDLNGSYVIQGPSPRLGEARKGVYASAIALSWKPNTRDTWTLQWNTEQSPTKTGDPLLDGDHRVMSFGYSRSLSKQSSFQIYFSEDGDFKWFRFPGGATVGQDFTIGARLVKTLE